MKKVLSLVLVLTLVLGSFAFAAPQDVVGTEYEDAVARLEQLKVLEGYPDGTFKPANTITRAEFAAVVVRAKGLDSAAQAAKGTTVFTDVPATNWASGYVNIASKMNFVKGMGDGTFAPNSPVTYEQAVTMVIRALGYEPAAEARGGYPYGYLIVANENGLLDAVKGVQGLPAPRGLVAQLVDNALEIPQMIQVGYGAQTKWVVSGTEDTDERLLLDDLGFTKIARERVTEINPDKNQIRLEKAGWKKVVEGFDFEEVHGLRLNAWLDGSGKVTVFTKVDAPKYDAVTKGEKLTLVGENKKYVVANKATLLLNDEEVEAADFQADYAKIVLNSDDEIVWAKGYTLDGFIVVNEVEEEVVYSYDSDELDIEDFTVIKDGKTITLEDLEEGDILFFNKAEAFAVVYNNSKTGELERVYDEQFKFAGKVYSINENAKYLDGNKIGQLKADELDAMVEEDKEVEVFFNLRGVAILVVGNRGEVPTNSFYGRVTAKTVGYTGRSGAMWSLDVRNEEAKVVNFDLTDKFVKNTGITDPKKNTYVGGIAGWATDIDVDAMVRITLDADGKPTKVELLDLLNLHKDFKIAATYAKTGTTDANAVDYRLESSTLVYEGKKVTKLGDAEGVFSVVKAGSKVYVENGRVKLVIGTTDADSDTTAYTGLVAKVRKLTSGAYEFTIKVAGETKVLLTDSTSLTVDKDDYEDEIVTVKVGNKSGKMVTFKDASDATVIADVVAGTSETVRVISTSNRTITTDTVVGSVYKVYELNAKAKLYDAEDSYAELQLRDLVKGDVITIYTDASSDRFVNYIIRTDAFDGTTPAPTQGAKFEGAFEVRGNTWVTIAGKDYIYAGPKTATQLNTQFAINDLVNFTLRTVDNETVVIDIVPAP